VVYGSWQRDRVTLDMMDIKTSLHPFREAPLEAQRSASAPTASA
jgi:hypothetical protein